MSSRTGPGQSVKLLVELIPVMDRLHISYAIIGALAAAYYGIVRASIDADVVLFLRGDQDLREQLTEQLKALPVNVQYREGDLFDPVAGVLVLSDQFGNRVDLLLGIHGLGVDAIERTATAELDQVRVNIIGLEDFIAMKVFAGSAQDLQDARSAIKVSRERINYSLLRTLAAIYGEEEAGKLEELLVE